MALEEVANERTAGRASFVMDWRSILVVIVIMVEV